MSFDPHVRGLERAVRRLEAAAHVGQQNCPRCRLEVRRLPADPKKAEDVVRAVCGFCGTQYEASLGGLDGRDREMRRLSYAFTIEDEYTDARAHALRLWYRYREESKKKLKTHAERQNVKKSAAGGRAGAKAGPGDRLYAQLQDELGRRRRREHERLARRYGGDPFPEQAGLIWSIRKSKLMGRTLEISLFNLTHEEVALLCCAEMEKIISGRVWPETEAEIAGVRRRIEENVDASKKKKARDEGWASLTAKYLDDEDDEDLSGS